MKDGFNKDVFIRSSIQDIDELLEYLYENVLLVYESSELNKLNGSRIDCNSFTKPIAGKIKIEYQDVTKVDTNNKRSKKILKSIINILELDNKVHFVPDGNKIISLLKHIRNAFAHNLVMLDGDYVLMGDFLSNKDGTPKWEHSTMLGRLSKDNLKLLVATIGEMKNKQ